MTLGLRSWTVADAVVTAALLVALLPSQATPTTTTVGPNVCDVLGRIGIESTLVRPDGLGGNATNFGWLGAACHSQELPVVYHEVLPNSAVLTVSFATTGANTTALNLTAIRTLTVINTTQPFAQHPSFRVTAAINLTFALPDGTTGLRAILGVDLSSADIPLGGLAEMSGSIPMLRDFRHLPLLVHGALGPVNATNRGVVYYSDLDMYDGVPAVVLANAAEFPLPNRAPFSLGLDVSTVLLKPAVRLGPMEVMVASGGTVRTAYLQPGTRGVTAPHIVTTNGTRGGRAGVLVEQSARCTEPTVCPGVWQSVAALAARIGGAVDGGAPTPGGQCPIPTLLAGSLLATSTSSVFQTADQMDVVAASASTRAIVQCRGGWLYFDTRLSTHDVEGGLVAPTALLLSTLKGPKAQWAWVKRMPNTQHGVLQGTLFPNSTVDNTLRRHRRNPRSLHANSTLAFRVVGGNLFEDHRGGVATRTLPLIPSALAGISNAFAAITAAITANLTVGIARDAVTSRLGVDVLGDIQSAYVAVTPMPTQLGLLEAVGRRLAPAGVGIKVHPSGRSFYLTMLVQDVDVPAALGDVTGSRVQTELAAMLGDFRQEFWGRFSAQCQAFTDCFYNATFMTNHTTSNSVQIAASFAAVPLDSADGPPVAIPVVPTAWNCLTTASSNFATVGTICPIFSSHEAVVSTGNVAPDQVSIKSKRPTDCAHWTDVMPYSPYFGWWSPRAELWWWDFATDEVADTGVFQQIAEARSHNFNFMAVNGYAQVLGMPLDQINFDKNVFGRLSNLSSSGILLSQLGTKLDDVLSALSAPSNVQIAGRASYMESTYSFQVEAVASLFVTLPGTHSGSANQLGTARLTIPLLLASTLNTSFSLVSPCHYSTSYIGAAGVDGFTIPMLHNMMAGPSQPNSTARVAINLFLDSAATPTQETLVSDAVVAVSMEPQPTLPGRGVQQVHAALNDRMQTSNVAAYCVAHPQETNLTATDCLKNKTTAIVQWVIYNGRSIPTRYVESMLSSMPRMADDFIQGPTVIRVPPAAKPLSELVKQTTDLTQQTRWLTEPSLRPTLAVSRMRQAVCPSTVQGLSSTVIINVNNATLIKNCTFGLSSAWSGQQPFDLESLIQSVNDGFRECNLSNVLTARLTEYEITANPITEICGKVSVDAASVGAIYNITLTTHSGPISFDGSMTLYASPIFAMLEDAGRVSETFYNPVGKSLGHGVWGLADLTDFMPDDICPPDLMGVMPRQLPYYSYTGTHLQTVEHVSNVAVVSQIAAGNVHFAPLSMKNPSEGATGTLEVEIDASADLGVVFQAPRLNGVSPNDTIPWHSLVTVATTTVPITCMVAANNYTFALVLSAEDRACSDISNDTAILGCPNDLLSVSDISITIPIKLVVGQRLNDTFLRDVLPQVPEPWSQMVSVAVIPAQPLVPGSVDQLAINVDGYSTARFKWRIPTSASIMPADPTLNQSVAYFYNATFNPPQARPILANTQISVKGSFSGTVEGFGEIGIVPVYGRNVEARTDFRFGTQQTVRRASIERVFSSLLWRLFDLGTASVSVNSSILFPDEQLDVIEVGFHGGVGMAFREGLNVKLTAPSETDTLAELNVYTSSFDSELAQLMTRLANTSYLDICAMVTDLAAVDTAVDTLTETTTILPLVTYSLGEMYQTAFGAPLEQLRAKACVDGDILDIHMLCTDLQALFDEPVCGTPVLNSLTHTLAVPIRWSVVDLHVRDALAINMNEIYSGDSPYERFPLMEGEDSQLTVLFSSVVQSTFRLNFASHTDVVAVTDTSITMTADFDVGGNLRMWFGPVSFQALDVAARLSAGVNITQNGTIGTSSSSGLAVQGTQCDATFVADLDLTELNPYCYVRITADSNFLTSGGKTPLGVQQYLCGEGGVGPMLEGVLQIHTLHESLITPGRFTTQFGQSFQQMIDGDVIFGSSGAIPNGIHLPLVGRQFELELRAQLAKLHSPANRKELSATLAGVGNGQWAATHNYSTVTGGEPSSTDLKKIAVIALTEVFCRMFVQYMPAGCPPTPVLAPPGDSNHTCLDGPCRWPLHLGRKYKHALTHLSDDMAGPGFLHLEASATETLDSNFEWALNVDLLYDDRQGPRLEFSYPVLLSLDASLDLNLSLSGRLSMLDAAFDADGDVSLTLAVMPPQNTTGKIDALPNRAESTLYDMVSGMLSASHGSTFSLPCQTELHTGIIAASADATHLDHDMKSSFAAAFYPQHSQCLHGNMTHGQVDRWYSSFRTDLGSIKTIFRRLGDVLTKWPSSSACVLSHGEVGGGGARPTTSSSEATGNHAAFVAYIDGVLAAWEAETVNDRFRARVCFQSISSAVSSILDSLQQTHIDWHEVGRGLVTILRDTVEGVDSMSILGRTNPHNCKPAENLNSLGGDRTPSQIRQARDFHKVSPPLRQITPKSYHDSVTLTQPPRTWLHPPTHTRRASECTAVTGQSVSTTGWQMSWKVGAVLTADADVGLFGGTGPHFKADLRMAWTVVSSLSASPPLLNFTEVQFCLGSFVQHIAAMLEPLHDKVLTLLAHSLGKESWLYQPVPLSSFLMGKEQTYLEFIKDVYDRFCDGDCVFDNVFPALERFDDIVNVIQEVSALSDEFASDPNGCSVISHVEGIVYNSSTGTASRRSGPLAPQVVANGASPATTSSTSALYQKLKPGADFGFDFPFLHDIGATFVDLLFGSTGRHMLVYDTISGSSASASALPSNGTTYDLRFMRMIRVDHSQRRVYTDAGLSVLQDANTLMRLTVYGASIGTHTLIGPFPVWADVAVFAKFGATAGFSDLEFVVPMNAVSQAVTNEDPWHVSRCLALELTNKQGNPVVPLYGSVFLEGGAEVSIALISVSVGVGIEASLAIGALSPSQDGLLTIGDVIWFLENPGQLKNAIVVSLGFDLLGELFVELTIPLFFHTIHITIVDWQKTWPTWERIEQDPNFMAIATAPGVINLKLASPKFAHVLVDQWQLSGRPGAVLVRGRHVDLASGLHTAIPSNDVAVGSTTPAIIPANTRHMLLVTTSAVSFSDDSTDGHAYSVLIQGFFSQVVLPSDSVCTVLVDVASHKLSRWVAISSTATTVEKAALLVMPATLRLLNISNPTLTTVFSVIGIRWPVVIVTKPFNNVSMTGVAGQDYTASTPVTLPEDLDSLSIAVWDTYAGDGAAGMYTITETTIRTRGDRLTVDFAGNINLLKVSGHPTQNGVFSVFGSPPNRNTVVTGGSGDDTFTVVDQKALLSCVEVNGGGGTDTLQSTFWATANTTTRITVSTDAIMLTAADTNHTLFLKNIDVRTVNLEMIPDASAAVTLPVARSGELYLLNTRGQPGATVTHRMYAMESTAQVRYHVVGPGNVAITLGMGGSLERFEGAVSVTGSQLEPGQNLTLVIDASQDPRTLRVEVQRNLITVVDTQSNQGILRVSHAHVGRLVVHSTDFVSVDHGVDANAYMTETELHVHEHTTIIPPAYVPTNPTRRREVELSRVRGTVAVFGWAPINRVRFGVYPAGPQTASWNNCTGGGIYCTEHPLSAVTAAVFFVAMTNASTGVGPTELSFASGTSSTAAAQYFRLDGNGVAMGHSNGTRSTVRTQPSIAFCRDLALYGTNMCDADGSGLPAVTFDTLPASAVIADHVSVVIETGNADGDTVYLNGTQSQLHVSLGGGTNTIRAENVTGAFTFWGGPDRTTFSLGFPLASGVINLGSETHMDTILCYGNGHEIAMRNDDQNVTLTNVSMRGDVITIVNTCHEDDIEVQSADPIPLCALCAASLPSGPLPAAPALPDTNLTTALAAGDLAVQAVSVGNAQWTYDAMSCGGLPFRIVKLRSNNGSHVVNASISTELCTVMVIGARSPGQQSTLTVRHVAGVVQSVSLLRDNGALHTYIPVSGSLNRIVYTNIKAMLVTAPSNGVYAEINQGTPVTNTLFTLPTPIDGGRGKNDLRIAGTAAHTTVAGVIHSVAFGKVANFNNPRGPTAFVLNQVILIGTTSGDLSLVTNASFDTGDYPTPVSSTFGVVGSCVGALSPQDGLAIISPLVFQFPVPGPWCERLHALVGVSSAVCVRPTCTVQFILPHTLFVLQPGPTATAEINGSLAAAIAIEQRASTTSDFWWSGSHTQLDLSQPGDTAAPGPAITSKCTMATPCGPATITWGGTQLDRSNYFTLLLQDKETAPSTPSDNGEFVVFTPSSGTVNQSVRLTTPGRHDSVVEQPAAGPNAKPGEVQTVSSTVRAASVGPGPATLTGSGSKVIEGGPSPYTNRTCENLEMTSAEPTQYTCESNTDYCIHANGNVTDAHIDCRNAVGTRIFVYDDPTSPQDYLYVDVWANEGSDVEVRLSIPDALAHIEGETWDTLYGIVRHRQFELKLDTVSRLVLESNGTLVLTGAFPPSDLVVKANRTVLTQVDGWVGANALIYNCSQCNVSSSIFSNEAVYLFAGLGTDVTVHTNASTARVDVIDGCVTIEGGSAAAPISKWLAEQAGGGIPAACTTGAGSHLFLNHTGSVLLSGVSGVAIESLGNRVENLTLPLATNVTVGDAVPWSGITYVLPAVLTDPQHRYCIHLPAEGAVVQVVVTALVEDLNVSCSGGAPTVNWTFTNGGGRDGGVPAIWLGPGCTGRVASRRNYTALHTITTVAPLTLLSYNLIAAQRISSANISRVGDFSMVVNGGQLPQLVDVGNTTARWPSTVSLRLHKVNGGLSRPTITVGSVELGSLTIFADGALVLDHDLAFGASDHTVTPRERGHSGHYCLPPKHCSAAEWEVREIYGSTLCLSENGERQCESTAIANVALNSAFEHRPLECSSPNNNLLLTTDVLDGALVGENHKSGSTRTATNRLAVQLLLGLTLSLVCVLAGVLHSAYMWPALWIMAPLWCTAAAGRDHFGSNGVYLLIAEATQLVGFLGTQAECNPGGVGLVPSTAIGVGAVLTWLVAVALFGAWAKRFRQEGIITAAFKDGARDADRIDLVAWRLRPGDMVWRASSFLAIFAVLVLFVPMATQFPPGIVGVGTVLLFGLVIVVARPPRSAALFAISLACTLGAVAFAASLALPGDLPPTASIAVAAEVLVLVSCSLLCCCQLWIESPFKAWWAPLVGVITVVTYTVVVVAARSWIEQPAVSFGVVGLLAASLLVTHVLLLRHLRRERLRYPVHNQGSLNEDDDLLDADANHNVGEVFYPSRPSRRRP